MDSIKRRTVTVNESQEGIKRPLSVVSNLLEEKKNITTRKSRT